MSPEVKPLPEKIGRYEVERVLGRGAMGTVYLAMDPHIQRRVALKTIRTELLQDTHDGGASEAELPARFINEARAAGRLVHPHIVGVFDYGEADGVAFIALEYVRGETLAARLAQHANDGVTMPLERVLVWFAQLLDAIAYAHELGVIHRDIKPANLLVAARGECKITDFGIAQLDTGRLTQVGMMIGTPTYMSPEQYSGAPIDARSDIFSAGVVLYEMLTGKCPFTGSYAAVMHQVLNEMPVAPSARNANLPGEIDAMVLKALAKRPDGRYVSAQHWRAEVLALLDRLTGTADPDRAKTPPSPNQQALAPPPPPADSRLAPADWSPDFLAQLERRLASHVGPVASRLVRRAAAQSTNAQMLAAHLALHLPDGIARNEFDTLLARHAAASRIEPAQAVTREVFKLDAATASTMPLDRASIDRAARQLATHLGPIARIVAQRAAVGADTATFHSRVADALPHGVDKEAFLASLKNPAA